MLCSCFCNLSSQVEHVYIFVLVSYRVNEMLNIFIIFVFANINTHWLSSV